MALTKDRRGVDKAWHLVDAGKLPEVAGKARYYNGQVWVNDAVNGVFPIAPQGAGGVAPPLAGYQLLEDLSERGHDESNFATLVSFPLTGGQLRILWSVEVKARDEEDAEFRVLLAGVEVARMSNFASEKKTWFGLSGLLHFTGVSGLLELQTRGDEDTYLRRARVELWPVGAL